MTSVPPEALKGNGLVQPMTVVMAMTAIVFPSLLAFNLPPSATFLNQAASLTGWGTFVTGLALQSHPTAGGAALGSKGNRAFSIALLLLIGSAWMASASSSTALPWGLALSSSGLIAAALAVGLTASHLQGRADAGNKAFSAFCLALCFAGTVSAGIAFIQYFQPGWADGVWIAVSAVGGRVGANLRQANHLSSLLLWSLVALVWLWEHVTVASQAGESLGRRASAWAVRALWVGLVFGVVLTVSRTGTVCIFLLALWGILDKGLSRQSRWMLGLTPLIYLLCWVGVDAWAQLTGHPFSGTDQLNKSDLSSSRFGIWSNTLSLIAQHPWRGVGWGEFNFAWTLTPFPGRPVAFFDHTHNLPLQFLVELGIPLGGLVLVLLSMAVWRAGVTAFRAPKPARLTVRSVFLMVLMMAVHSLLEYPLWYAYFLLPTAFALGTCLGGSEPGAAARQPAQPPRPAGLPRTARGLAAAGVAMVLGGVLAVHDYLGVASIFTPSETALPLSERIDEGQRSWFFAHHADYAAATVALRPSQEMDAFKGAPHYLLDTRLMMAWAQAFHERGDEERARYLAQRLKEFRSPDAKDFFSVCDAAPATPSKPLPFQCVPPTTAFTHEDFRSR